MRPSKPWKPYFTSNCCSIEDQTVLGKLTRPCRPSRSDFSKNIAPFPSFRRLSFSDLSRSSSLRINEDLAQSFGSELYDFQLITCWGRWVRTVHKGYIDENFRQGLKAQAVAVKLLDIEGLQGHREWLAEVIFLGQLRHPHLVKLIGYCCEDEERLLVYEFMPRGSLENHLFKRISVTLPWATRLRIAIGAAKGLAFLHGAENPVIYRDFKTSNVLLDSDFTAKLSDFGLAKMGPEGSDTHVTTRVMGTFGYAAPEYVSTGHLTTKSDVYSFGVVLLELLTGRRATDKSRPKSEQNLVDWARPYLTSTRRLRYIMDPRLAGQYSVKGAKEMANLALHCISVNPKDRPRMSVIVETLESLQHFKDMAVTCGQWAANSSPKTCSRNWVSTNKVKMETRGANFVKASPIVVNPSRKT
ncbi:hypothetical protein FNV43_RR09666 [Rhamnella rubrinervis]|uniref:Protein kinase domain-containing protein n=1 Tax=Rhamnella rubrinervis TaxID=2594499 RepID=A0A8K0HAH5_9ROSA|nr:hypothetical protein FNV43_RR09666 [Rhamnella rubrinervis]